MNNLNKTIEHFESLQKRYTTQHNGQMCERVADALEALYFFKSKKCECKHNWQYIGLDEYRCIKCGERDYD
jgi:hypothetical protein